MTSNQSFCQHTSGTEVAESYASRASGRTVLVTGVTLGSLGEGIARAFAHGGASTVIITGRDAMKLTSAQETLSADYPKTIFRPLELNLSSLVDVRASAQEILNDSSIAEIDILIANAGIQTGENTRTVTVDNIELHFAVNHLAHHLFITILLPKLEAAAQKHDKGDTRVVLLTSGALAASPIRFSDWNYENKPVPPEESSWSVMVTMMGALPEPEPFEYSIAYGQSKTANVLFAVQLNKLFASKGIYGFASNPGLVQTNGMKKFAHMIPPGFEKIIGITKTVDQGSATTLVAALDPGLEPKRGVFLNHCQVAMDRCPPHASDEGSAERLWLLSEQIISEKLGE